MADLHHVLQALRRGKMIVLIDDESRENEADIIFAAQFVTPTKISFLARFGRGLICVPLEAVRAQKLHLYPLPSFYSTPLQHCHFTESVDAKKGISTGISAADRAATIQALVNKTTRPEDLSRPGHVFPLVGQDGGVLVRPGHTEGTLDLLRFADLLPVGVICEIMDDRGHMLTAKTVHHFAKRHGLPIISMNEIIEYRKRHENNVQRIVSTKFSTDFGSFQAHMYGTPFDKKEHLVFVKGRLGKNTIPLTRIHSECITGDLFQSKRCDCRWQFEHAMRTIGQSKAGIFIYLRQEGRGIGLINKLKAYNVQDRGFDTVEANKKLGFEADLRDYSTAGQILRAMGVKRIQLLTNNPEKVKDLGFYGISVAKRIPLEMAPQGKKRHSKKWKRYFKTKKTKLGHLLRTV